MLQALSLTYSPNPQFGNLFDHLCLTLAPGERVALLGRNGTGKTKLMEILAGRLQPDHGQVLVEGRIGYLPQDVDLSFKGTLREFLADDPEQEVQLPRVISRMGLRAQQLDQEYASLSIGERMRAALAKLQMDEPSVLLLDEPTNNLDFAGREWLTRFLKESHASLLMVCHDRSVIDALADRVLELSPSGLKQYSGGYSDMLREKEIHRANQAELYERQKREDKRLRKAVDHEHATARSMIRKPTTRTYDPKAKAFYSGKQAKLDRRASAIRSRVKQLAEQKVDKPFEEIRASIEFKSRALRSSDALVVRGLAKTFGDRKLFSGFNLTLESGKRLALIGPNGVGKTTLFRILLGEDTPTSGEVRWSSDAEPLYLSQARSRLDLDMSILEALRPENRDEETRLRNLLGCLRIHGDAAHKPIGVLSVGERTKVELVSMLLSSANVLLLDEPTNHLDIDSLEALEEALEAFPGSILFTSHDKAFIERMADEVVTM